MPCHASARYALAFTPTFVTGSDAYPRRALTRHRWGASIRTRTTGAKTPWAAITPLPIEIRRLCCWRGALSPSGSGLSSESLGSLSRWLYPTAPTDLAVVSEPLTGVEPVTCPLQEGCSAMMS